MTIIFKEPEVFNYVSDSSNSSDTDKSSLENRKRSNVMKVKDAVINFVKKTKNNVSEWRKKSKSMLYDNNLIKRESRTKRSFYLSDNTNSCSIEEFAPKIFQSIRQMYKIRNEHVLSIFKEG